MARKKHEDHINHEAWAIPYADMVTLLLAFFVVMYSISAVNEGKYRVLSDALSQAFGGPPKSMKPVQVGSHRQSGADSDQRINIFQQNSVEQSLAGDMRNSRNPVVLPGKNKIQLSQQQASVSGSTGYAEGKAREALQHMADAVEKAMGPLIDRKLIAVRKTELKLEIEIRTDILFGSGSASLGDKAQEILARLAGILKPFPNTLRIEGHTDNLPIHTVAFSSNWELSAARAASVVHLFTEQGVEPTRMSVEG
ncbi:MAG: flagellar motor protein MotD, partial [Stenotrophomonas sp.]|nr:flagellar motor protein MotD [Stenotrophomonas sp.]